MTPRTPSRAGLGPRMVTLVNRADDKRIEQQGLLPGMRAICQAVQAKNGKRCTSEARWSFTLDDQSEVAVCRSHANAGERQGELYVMTAEPSDASAAAWARVGAGERRPVAVVVDPGERRAYDPSERSIDDAARGPDARRMRSFRLPDNIYAHLRAYAAARHLEMTEVIITLIAALPAPPVGKKGPRP
jgi:hypothetical protein